MRVKFDEVKPGIVLWDVRKQHGGVVVRPVTVLQVDRVHGRASCSWNGNSPTVYSSQMIERLWKDKPTTED